MKTVTLIFSIILFLSACTGSSDKTKVTTKDSKEEAIDVQPVAEEVQELPGLALYEQHCLPCHQSDGNGVPGMFPPLLDSEWLNKDIMELVAIIDNGLEGEIEVKGEIYDTPMAAIPGLSDQEITDILSYIRKEFGSAEGEISITEVKNARESL